ncbi:unnamed protein product [Rotaria magnacalcarata]|uniref:Uncharacterized protein n=1 Tax=Rotaria magnacalcarata TaxID=392030 RepID=A0A819SLD3_9BILA|nr:unnamed protein product [Rotaria magnacalcarata]CAF3859025.1 unnamed protein product [Rotaria magnacalcarata]CAF4064776.1 unnamed protein product [Rotaria magnacalcarata]
MAKTNAERMKKYRDKIKKIRTKLTAVDLTKFRLQAKNYQQKCRENKRKRLINIPSVRTFKTHQSFSKTLKKKTAIIFNTIFVVFRADGKRRRFSTFYTVFTSFTAVYAPFSWTWERTSLKFADKLKDDVHNFYVRNDISYQLPGKRDVVVAKEDDGRKITYQKRILLNSLRENDELFKEENKNVNLSRSSFAELRSVFVILKAALVHRNCLCFYH